MDPARAAHDAGLDVGDVGSDRYHRALEYLLEAGAVVGDDADPSTTARYDRRGERAKRKAAGHLHVPYFGD